MIFLQLWLSEIAVIHQIEAWLASYIIILQKASLGRGGSRNRAIMLAVFFGTLTIRCVFLEPWPDYLGQSRSEVGCVSASKKRQSCLKTLTTQQGLLACPFEDMPFADTTFSFSQGWLHAFPFPVWSHSSFPMKPTSRSPVQGTMEK